MSYLASLVASYNTDVDTLDQNIKSAMAEFETLTTVMTNPDNLELRVDKSEIIAAVSTQIDFIQDVCREYDVLLEEYRRLKNLSGIDSPEKFFPCIKDLTEKLIDTQEFLQPELFIDV